MRKAIIQLFGGNFLSKIIGLVREILVAAFFGTGSSIAAYRIAQTGTLVPINFFTSDSLNSAFIPLYKNFYNESEDKAQTLFWVLLVLFFILSLFLAGLLWLVGDYWIGILAPGLDKETSILTSSMLYIMGVGVPFYLISTLIMFLGMAREDFVPMAARPAVQNLGLLSGAVLAFFLKNALYLAWGFTASYIAFFIWIVIRYNQNSALRFPSNWVLLQIRSCLSIFWNTLKPLVLLPFFLQGNITIERAIATMIGLVAVSALDYARFITETLIFLVSIPVAFAGLSSWSGLKPERLRIKLIAATELMLIVSVPVSVFLACNSNQIVALLYKRGAFDTVSVQATGDILMGISLGLWAQVIGYVLIKALNSQLKNKRAMLIMFVALAANVFVNIGLYKMLGTITLGLGNAAYGVVLLVGTLLAFDLMKSIASVATFCFLGSIGYFIVNELIAINVNPWVTMVTNCLIALIYWVTLIVSIPFIRIKVLGLIKPNGGDRV